MTDSQSVDEVRVIDSHTEGEPTRVIIDGWPSLTGDTMQERLDIMRQRDDQLRRGIVCEPRGHDAIVGALMTPPVSDGAACGVIFFNDVGYLGMCGHGLIGVVETLAHTGRLTAGEILIDTPVGPVTAKRLQDGATEFRNVPSYCDRLDVSVDVPEIGVVTGDVAWGGNWFFITPYDVRQPIGTLMQFARRVRDAIKQVDARVDHIELYGQPTRADADARNFVLCPGAAYDRSPCGTGTSAKMATLHARGALAPGQLWRQESVTGSLFTGWLEESNGALVPHIRGRAYVTGESTLRFERADPFRWGIPTTS